MVDIVCSSLRKEKYTYTKKYTRFITRSTVEAAKAEDKF